ncbi:MAG: hypothetical protein COB15_09485 [Flavobacteriales bacterium]|nr:MAG: hypothetical protein COB15_09485 [Flavobacteriales bacterium]
MMTANKKKTHKKRGTVDHNTIQKHYDFLKELNEMIADEIPLSTSSVAKRHKVNTSMGTLLMEGKVIKLVKRHGHKSTYEWTGGNPSFKMAEEAIKRHNKSAYDRRQEKDEAQKELANKAVETQPVVRKEVKDLVNAVFAIPEVKAKEVQKKGRVLRHKTTKSKVVESVSALAKIEVVFMWGLFRYTKTKK